VLKRFFVGEHGFFSDERKETLKRKKVNYLKTLIAVLQNNESGFFIERFINGS
jgi:hypothetical protein